MSTAPATAGLSTQRWSLKYYLILAALILVVAAGAFGLLSRTSTAPVEADETAPVTVEPVPVRGGDGNCAERFVITGGVLEGDRASDRCPAPGGQPVTGGVLP